MPLKTALIVDGSSDGGKQALVELERSIERADREARQLAAAFSAVDVATTRLAQAQVAAKTATDASKTAFAAGEIKLGEYNRQLLETKTALGLVEAEHRSTVAELRKAQGAYDGAIGQGQRFVRSVGEQRIGAQQLAMNLGDMTTMFALGARPMQIFASQSGQVIQSISLMSGGTSKFAAFMMSGWGTAITAGAMVLVPLIGYLLDTKDAAEEVEFASYQLGDAQSILGQIFDLTTGKIKAQSNELLALARAQAIAGQVAARNQQAEARTALGELRRPTYSQGSRTATGGAGLYGSGLQYQQNANPVGDVLAQFQAGKKNAEDAERALRGLLTTGKATEEQYLAAAKAVTDFAVGAANEQVFKDLESALGGDSEAMQQFLKPKQDHSRARRASGPTLAEIAQQHAEEMRQLQQEELRAQIDLTTDARDRADLEQQLMRVEFDDRVAQINNNKHFSAAQKRAQVQALEGLYGVVKTAADGSSMVLGTPGLLQQGINRERDRHIEQEAQQLAELQNQVSQDALQAQMDLADTEAGRKSLALQIYDAETAYLRSKLEAIAASETATEVERQRAQIELHALNATAAMRREGVSRANATSVERYLRELHQTPEQVSEAIDAIKVRGLEALNDELTETVAKVLKLGGVFGQVANQIVSDLIRIAVQRSIIAPLADMLFPGSSGGPTNLLAGTGHSGGGGLFGLIGSLFGGGRASGGSVSPDKFYTVNERSTAPGLFFPLSPGRIEPPGNDNGRFAQPVIVQLRVARGELFDVEVERISGNVAVQTVEGYAPAIVEASAAETTRRFTRPRL